MSTTVRPGGLAKRMRGVLGGTKKRALDRQDVIVRGVAVRLFGGIVEGTPVGDFDPDNEGTARGSWMFSIGRPGAGRGRRNAKKTGADLGIPKRGLAGKRMFLVSSVPWIPVIEYGGYKPLEPVRGTWHKRLKVYQIRSAGGFSKQAPRGMIRLNVARLPEYVREAVGR